MIRAYIHNDKRLLVANYETEVVCLQCITSWKGRPQLYYLCLESEENTLIYPKGSLDILSLMNYKLNVYFILHICVIVSIVSLLSFSFERLIMIIPEPLLNYCLGWTVLDALTTLSLPLLFRGFCWSLEKIWYWQFNKLSLDKAGITVILLIISKGFCEFQSNS